MRSTTHRRGAAAIEFAMILPIFVAIMFGIIEYGWVFFQQANVIASVRDGTRYSVTLPQQGAGANDCPDNKAAAESKVRAELLALGFAAATLDGPDTTIEGTCEGESPDEVIVLKVSIPYDPLIGAIPVPAAISAKMTMLLELQD